jgi:penicillin amidase
MLEAYARGVNAFIAQKRWPLEYAILKTSPQRFEPWHCIAIMRQIGFLMGSVWWKLWRAAALPIVGAAQIAKLRFDDGGDDLLCIPPGEKGGRMMAALADLKPGLAALLGENAALAGAEISGGSNNWALSGERTATGRPILAGDPHRQLEMPGMYYQAHLTCDEFDVIGLTVPGVPGFPHFGHTAHVAWGVTHAFVDIHDLYLERFDTDGQHYLYQESWLPTVKRDETISVRGNDDIKLTVTETRHGPVVSGDPATGAALTLRSTQFALVDKSFDCLVPMLKATTINAFYEASRGWGLIDHNLVAADTSGHIGHRVRALVPKRPLSNGWLPVPGWSGAHEWQGMVPFEEMPCQIDPPGGTIVTANNRVVSVHDKHHVSVDSMPPHRARRIMTCLARLKEATVDDMPAIHRDLYSIPGTELRERVRALTMTGKAENLRRLIIGWDGQMTADSRAAAAYASFRAALTRIVLQRSGLGATADSACLNVSPGVHGQNQLWWTIPQLVRANDRTLLNGATWEELLREALTVAGEAASTDTWGAMHRPILKHQLSPAFPEHAWLLDKPSAVLSGDNDTVMASGYQLSNGFQATSSSLSRYVFDVGGWDNCHWIVFHGTSGHVGSPWYLNQNEAWSKGELVPMLYDWAQIEASASTHQQLKPG